MSIECISIIVSLVALIVSLVTLFFAFLIHSETRDALGRINAIADTLPGAYDVKRLIKDIETNKGRRGQVICTEPKNTYIAWNPQDAKPLRAKDRFWNLVRKIANAWSGDIYQSLIEVDNELEKKQNIIYHQIGCSSLQEKLSMGWVPFAVEGNGKVWLRKVEVSKKV